MSEYSKAQLHIVDKMAKEILMNSRATRADLRPFAGMWHLDFGHIVGMHYEMEAQGA